MTTSDPVLYPVPQTEAESIRQDAARARLALANTVEALAARLNARRHVVRKIRSATRRAGPAWAAGAGVASAAVVAGLARRGAGRTRRSHWAAGGVAAVVSVLTYVAVRRRQGPSRPSRQAQRGLDSGGRHNASPQSGSQHSGSQHSGSRHNASPQSGSQHSGSQHSGSRQSGGRESGDPHSDDRQAQRGGHSMAVESISSAVVTAPSVRSGPLAPNPTGRDVVDVLRDQHRRIDGMFAWVRSTDGAARREAFAAIVEVLHRHERSEQEIVHPVLAELDGAAAWVAANRRDEEGKVDRSIASLIRRGVGNSRFAADFDELRNEFRVHVTHEEAIEFPLLRERVSDDRLLTMANEVQAAQAESW